MAEYVDTKTRTFQASAAIDQWILVKLSAAETVAAAGLAEQPIGVTTRETFAANDDVAVALLSGQGTIKCTAANAITVGAVVYGRADGKVDDVSTSSAVQIGVALEAATASGDIIEVLPISA